MQLLKTQLLLKGIITNDDWKSWKEKISFDFIEDNYFAELKQGEMVRERFDLLSTVQDHIGTYLSQEWVMKNVLRMSEEEVKDMEQQIDQEKKDGKIPDGEEDDLGF